MSTASWKDALKEVQKPLPHMGKTWKNGWCHLGRIGGGAIGEQKPARDVQLQDVQLQDVQVWLGANILGSLVSLTSILLSTIAAISESHRIAGFMIQPYPIYRFCMFLSSGYSLLSVILLPCVARDTDLALRANLVPNKRAR